MSFIYFLRILYFTPPRFTYLPLSKFANNSLSFHPPLSSWYPRYYTALDPFSFSSSQRLNFFSQLSFLTKPFPLFGGLWFFCNTFLFTENWSSSLYFPSTSINLVCRKIFLFEAFFSRFLASTILLVFHWVINWFERKASGFLNDEVFNSAGLSCVSAHTNSD